MILFPKKGACDRINRITIKTNEYYFSDVCHDVVDPFSKFWDLDSRLGGYGTHVIDSLFFKFIWKTKIEIQDLR